MAEFSEMTAHALSAEHFQRYPVWRFLGPEEASDPDADESCVLPHTSGVSLGDNASYLVSATFALESQQQLSGFVEVTVIGQQSQFIPGAVFAGGRAVEALSKEAAVRLERDPEEEGRTASLLGTRCPHLWRRQSPEGGHAEARACASAHAACSIVASFRVL